MIFKILKANTVRKHINILITLIILIGQVATCPYTLYSQKGYKYNMKEYQAALKYFSQEEYEKALHSFLYLDSIPIEQLASSQQSSAISQQYVVDGKQVPEIKILIKYHIGMCYKYLNYNRLKGIPYFEYVLKSRYDRVPDSIYVELGNLYHRCYQFEKALRCFEKYINLKESSVISHQLSDKNYDVAKRMIEINKEAQSIYSDSLKINIVNIGEPINTNNSEYNPLISADNTNLYFNRVIYFKRGNVQDSVTQIMVSHKQDDRWQTIKPLTFEPALNFKQVLLAGLSPDGGELFLQIKDKGVTEIYSCRLTEDKCENLKKLNSTINSGYNQGKVSETADGTELYFSSDRPGGYGRKDIYKANRELGLGGKEYGEWGNVINLGPAINTKYDEEAPFIHPDKRTLYFLSNGHNTIGGFDIFKSSLMLNKQWSHPVNIGYPINTTNNEIDFTISASGQTGYYSREQATSNRDIYMFTLNQNIPLTLVKGTILAGEPLKPVAAKIKVIDKETNTRVKYIYNPNPKTGKYLLIFPPGKDYDIIIESKDYLPQLINVHIPNQTYFYELFQEIHLKPVNLLDKKLGEEISVSNTFTDVYKTPAGEEIISKSNKKDYGKLLDVVENLIKTTDSLGMEKIDDAYDKLYKGDEIKKDSIYKIDIDKLLNLIEKAIETTDSNTLYLLDKNTIYRKDYIQKYFYSEEKPKDLNTVVIGKDTLKTAPPLNTKEHDIKLKSDSSITRIISSNKKTDVKNIKPEDKKIILTYSVYFATGKANIEEKYFTEMREIVKLLKKNDNLYIEVYGYCDSRGGEEENLVLSKKRAEAVLGYFSDSGINTETAILRNFGKSMSKDEKTDKERQKDRRADVKIFEYLKK